MTTLITFIKNLVATLTHKGNVGQILTSVFGVIVILAAHTGTLPAPLEAHRDIIELLASIATALGLVSADPKSSDSK